MFYNLLKYYIYVHVYTFITFYYINVLKALWQTFSIVIIFKKISLLQKLKKNTISNFPFFILFSLLPK